MICQFSVSHFVKKSYVKDFLFIFVFQLVIIFLKNISEEDAQTSTTSTLKYEYTMTITQLLLSPLSARDVEDDSNRCDVDMSYFVTIRK